MNAKLEEIKDKNILLPKMRIKKGRKQIKDRTKDKIQNEVKKCIQLKIMKRNTKDKEF